ncbi:MAG: hypothetical protein UT61_C0020G0005 [Candidatus Woesebacteria bacterium GW2011_GWA1_39_8]|uniref:Glycosyltransferase RgtA/B/C/D-like domain-containing protein n=1 Tax=Candidatus Woesebacteria bacterium GW2011_GWA1_39_8 TaxID=1618552 RepID=A0A0G0SW70_9BACT|nr:MAG: hypothetical protein UT61_C0020G0005 [Candidatus Woesebacteria bacterium GW2011_GWA1_39_8]
MMKKVKEIFRNKYTIYFMAILLIGFFLRIYKAQELFLYGHDQELTGWFIRDVLVNGHLRLIGQETSTAGVFIGPFYYYLSIPFYLLAKFDPIGGVWLVTLLGIISLISVYYVVGRTFGQLEALISTLIYSASFYMVFNDREVVPTMPVILWTVWFIFGLQLLVEKKTKKAMLVFGILTALIWHLNFALILTLPLIPIAIILTSRKANKREMGVYLGTTAALSLPLILFEIKHNFIQTKAIIASLTTNQHDVVMGYDKLIRVIYLMSKDVYGLFMGNLDYFSYGKVLFFLLAVFVLLKLGKKITKFWFTIFLLWIALFITFFATYSKIVSEYYLNGTMIVFIIIASLFITTLLKSKDLAHWGAIVVGMFLVFNLNKFFTININASGYVEKKALVYEIKDDMRKHGYPCFAISYITDPGYNLGYRYFFWLYGLHVNHPDSGSPVYTIVYPLNDMFKVDKTFGALGLIYPNFASYTKEAVDQSCAGENSNITDPMWGLTQ